MAARTTFICRECRIGAVEPPSGTAIAWLDGGPGWLERLRATVEHQETVQQILESDDEDPRWQRMMV